MPNKGQDITTYLEMDISGLKKAISEANANLKLIKSQFNEVAGHTTKWEHNVDLLTKKLEALAAEEKYINQLIQQHTAIFKKAESQYKENKEKAEDYKKQLQDLAERGVKKSSDEYQKLARELEVCEGHMYDARIEMKKQDTTINNLNGDLLRVQKEQKKYTEELANAIKEEERQNSALGKLESSIEDQEKALDDLKDEYKQVVVEQGKNSDSAKELAKKIDDLSGELKENKEKLKDASDAADDLDQSLDDTKTSTDKAKDGFTVLKGVVVNFVTEALHKAIDGFKDLMDKAIEFESSFADVRKVLGDVPTEDLEELEQSIRDLSLVRPETASEISEITAMAAQLGVRGNDNLMTFTDTMVKLGDSTNLTGEEAAETFAKFINIMGTSQKDIDRVGAAVVNLGNNFATTEKDIAEMSMRLGAAGKLAGMSEAEVMGVAAALSSVGINAEAGGSAFSKLIINMSNASANGAKANEIIASTGQSLRDLQMLSDSDSRAFKELAQSLGYTSDEFSDFLDASATLEQFSKVTGMTAEEFNKAYGEDAVGTIQKFINSLAGMSDSQALQTLDEMGIKEIRLRDTILRSTTGVENFNKALEVSNQGWEENIALDNEANQRYKTTESRIKMTKNKFIDLGISMKKKLQPAIDALLDALNWIADNADTVGGAILIIASAIGTFILVTKVIPAVTAAFQGLWLTLTMNPIAVVVAAIAALITMFVLLWNKCEWFRDFWINLWDTITTIASVAWDFIKTAFETAIKFIVKLFGAIPKWFQDRWEDIKAVFAFVVSFFKETFQLAYDSIVSIFKAIGGWFGDRWEDIKAVFAFVVSFFKEIFQDAYDGVTGIFDAIGGWFGDRWTDIKNAFGAVGEWFKNVFQEAYDNITGIFKDIGDWFDGILEKVGLKTSGLGKKMDRKIKEELKKQGYSDAQINAMLNNQMASGGVLEKGQIGFLEGNGAEAVVPLDQNKKWIHALAKTMQKEFGLSSASSMVNNGPKTVNYTQIINAPKQPSRIELYRQTRNLLNFKEGGV